MEKCNTCKDCWVNTNSDEAYCEAADGEQIVLRRGQSRPSWCPKRQRAKGRVVNKISISKEDFATLCICAIRYCQGRETYMPSLVQGIVRNNFDYILDKDLKVMLWDCDFQRMMDLYGDEQIDKPGWLRWKQDLKDEIRMRSMEDEYERATEQMEHDNIYEPTYNQEDGSM